jgi:hypothetical protein
VSFFLLKCKCFNDFLELDYLDTFYRKAGRTKHLKVCKEIGIYERNDIVAFVCSDCGYIAKSSRGLTQHRVQGSNCQERTFSKTMSRLELSITNGDSNVALDQSSGLSCCGRKFSNKSGLISHQRSKAHKEVKIVISNLWIFFHTYIHL